GLSTPCDADAEYESVVIRGYAHVLTDTEQKRTVLTEVIRKYAPQLAQLEMTEARVRGTAVVEIEPVSITGKYHR
ncbi:MAG: pyridoxamine 5'-phosphate oxidase family protein, partial [Clostridiales bacterium]|nr:pyridoxamine 5'-phosphate oxidase family protein [Clostridiales bacterium]